MTLIDDLFDPTWAGTDEVGRGCLAGPVVAAAVKWRNGPPDYIGQLRDSKKLTSKKREELAVRLVVDDAVDWSVAWRLPQQIDQTNILTASLDAMAEAIAALGPVAGIYIDGNQGIPVDCCQETVVGGDDLVPQISAASIVAKVFRDRWMACLDDQFPGYDWASNKGYGTERHLSALEKLGPTPVHRHSFGPIRQRSLFGSA